MLSIVTLPPRLSRPMAAVMILSVMLACISGFALVAQPANAVDNGSLGIRPSNESDFFHLSVLPGETINATAIVSNHTAVDVELETYAVDGLTTETGAFALKAEDDLRTQVGQWTHNLTRQITVTGQSQLAVPFAITVPLGAKPGDYQGGLIIQSPPVEGATTNSGGTPVRIDVVQRQGVRIYLTVEGEAHASVTPGVMSWVKGADSVTLKLPVKNTGNVTLQPTATASVDAWFAAGRTVTFASPENVPPGTTVIMTAKYPTSPLLQIANIQATVISAAPEKHASTTVFDVPWQLFAAFLLLIVVALFGGRRFARFVRTARIAIAEQNNRSAANSTNSETAGHKSGNPATTDEAELCRDTSVSPRQ